MAANSYFEVLARIAEALEQQGGFREGLKGQRFDFETDDGVRAALAAVSCAAAATLPDSVTKDKVTYARRGSLGANSYVVTNIVVEPPSYQLSRVSEMKLRDRCVNYATVEGTNAVFALPARKSVAGYARTMLVYVDVTNETGCAVSFTGADALYTTDWYSAPRIGKGKSMFSIMELADNQYLVEMRELERIGGE